MTELRKIMLFQPGRIVATPGALATMTDSGIDAARLLARHLTGDWGNVDEHDQKVNDAAVRHGSRIFSSYGEGDAKLWVITEADRSSTTILRPDEY